MRLLRIAFIICFASFGFVACDEDDTAVGDLTLNIEGLETLGPDFTYEGWLMIDGVPYSTGKFTVSEMGELSTSSFPVDRSFVERAKSFVLTIEPVPDEDSGPSKVHLMAGEFFGNTASLTVGDQAALGSDFLNVSGSYILATPTNGESTNEFSGVWWLAPNDGPGPSLDLPVLPAGWTYEGWAVINGIPVTTGKFTGAEGADNFNGYSSTGMAPPFPGEDFLINAPAGLTFPTDLRNMTVVISVEPSPDNLPTPFTLKPLNDNVPSNADDYMAIQMANIALNTNPVGIATR